MYSKFIWGWWSRLFMFPQMVFELQWWANVNIKREFYTEETVILGNITCLIWLTQSEELNSFRMTHRPRSVDSVPHHWHWQHIRKGLYEQEKSLQQAKPVLVLVLATLRQTWSKVTLSFKCENILISLIAVFFFVSNWCFIRNDHDHILLLVSWFVVIPLWHGEAVFIWILTAGTTV